MGKLLALSFIPLICMGVIILTGILIIFALRRGTRTISEKLNDRSSSAETSTPANDRWARGDMENTSRSQSEQVKTKKCPACGGENTSRSGTCAYCSSKI
jgi:hypothetical protein